MVSDATTVATSPPIAIETAAPGPQAENGDPPASDSSPPPPSPPAPIIKKDTNSNDVFVPPPPTTVDASANGGEFNQGGGIEQPSPWLPYCGH